jgi:PAT family acetyl-CoA transporter-like MFS transporter 1
MSISGIYKQIWSICKLKRRSGFYLSTVLLHKDPTDVQLLMVIHLFAKIGFAGSEAGTSLKLVEKGFRREDLAVMVLIDFPFQIVGGWLAAKWSRGDRPLRPWLYAFWPRFFFAFTATLVVYYFPKQPLPLTFFLLMIVHTVLSSFAT